MKKVILGVLAILAIVSLVACSNKEEVISTPETTNNEVVEPVEIIEPEETIEQEIPKNEQIGTAGSNIPLKDNAEEAEYQIKVAMQYLLQEAYGDDVFDARIYVEKIYTAEEEQEEPLKSMNLGIDDIAFEVKYELKPAVGVDVNQFLAGTGEYDEESGWVKEKYNVGVLRPNGSGDQKYIITDFGTGF